jgi:hypothetical protein
MAPLSVLPGRIRFESSDIVGKFMISEYLEGEIQRLDGVLEASVNYRTGRILVKFNENLTNRKILTEGIKEIIKHMPERQLRAGFHNIKKTKDAGGFKLELLDAVANLVLPKPFNTLLSLAINALKR